MEKQWTNSGMSTTYYFGQEFTIRPTTRLQSLDETGLLQLTRTPCVTKLCQLLHNTTDRTHTQTWLYHDMKSNTKSCYLQMLGAHKTEIWCSVLEITGYHGQTHFRQAVLFWVNSGYDMIWQLLKRSASCSSHFTPHKVTHSPLGPQCQSRFGKEKKYFGVPGPSNLAIL
jgi:hypothetical protein